MRIYFAGGCHCNEYIARRLIREGHDLVLMEHDEERCHQLSDTLDARVIQGDATSIDDWGRSELAEADMFIACTDSDETNIMACLIADDIAPAAKKAIRWARGCRADRPRRSSGCREFPIYVILLRGR